MNVPASDDREAHLVYADYLTERGDPRGELIAVQIRREDAQSDKALKKREEQLLREHGRTWLGVLADADPMDFGVTWRWGFIDAARIGNVERHWAGKIDGPQMIEQLLALPHIDRCRALVIGSQDFEDEPLWQPHIDKLAAIGVPPALRRLEITRGNFWDISGTILGDLSPLYPRLGALEELRIEMGEMELGAIELPALRKLDICTGGLNRVNLDSITQATWPALGTLALCLGTSRWGCTILLDDLTPIFDGSGLPHVKHLGLANSDLADQIAAMLATSAILPRLETLDLSRGTLGDEGARAILDHWGRFAHLAQLDLSASYLSRAVVEELAARGAHVLLDGMRGGGRYVSIGE